MNLKQFTLTCIIGAAMLISAFTLSSCSNVTKNYIQSSPEMVTLEGLYTFEESGSGEVSGVLELAVDYKGAVDAIQVGTFRSSNPNGSFGTHPYVRFSNVVPVSDHLLTFSRDVTYNSKHDLERDDTGNDLGSGKRYTVYNLKLREDELMELTIQIHAGC